MGLVNEAWKHLDARNQLTELRENGRFKSLSNADLKYIGIVIIGFALGVVVGLVVSLHVSSLTKPIIGVTTDQDISLKTNESIESFLRPEAIDEQVDRLEDRVVSGADAVTEIKDKNTSSNVLQNSKHTANLDNSNLTVKKSELTQRNDVAVSILESNTTHNREEMNQALDVNNHPDNLVIQSRILLSQSPEKVLPFLRMNAKDLSNNITLLAVAAQAEQRSGRHQSALSIYKNLQIMQPNDLRWQVGYTMSLDATGEHVAALRLYRILGRAPLPKDIDAFVRSRLTVLGKAYD